MTGQAIATYSSTKDSAVEWIGSIPEEWLVKPLFGVSNTETAKNFDGAETNVLSLSYGNIIRRDVDQNFGLLPESFNTYQLVQSGNLILRLTDLQNDKRSLRVGYAFESGIITSAYLKLIADPNWLDSRYLYRLLHSYDTTKVFYGMGGGLRQSMQFEDMRRLPILIPPLPDQQKIANFLDHETAKIDTLIEKQQQLIKLLKEKRQVVIGKTVTKGLDPNAPMKDSGVEWLGEVPAHWDMRKFKHVSRIVRGGSPRPAGDPLLFNGSYSPWVTVAEITGDEEIYLKQTDSFLTKLGSEQCRVFKAGTLLYSNSGATLGVPKILAIDANANDGVVGFEKLSVDITYAYYFLLFQTADLRERTKQGSGQPNLNTDIVGNMEILLPPKEEVAKILDSIEQFECAYKKLLAMSNSAVSKLNERRTALISAAVTGKIDVRNWQPPEPTSTSSMDA